MAKLSNGYMNIHYILLLYMLRIFHNKNKYIYTYKVYTEYFYIYSSSPDFYFLFLPSFFLNSRYAFSTYFYLIV